MFVFFVSKNAVECDIPRFSTIGYPLDSSIIGDISDNSSCILSKECNEWKVLRNATEKEGCYEIVVVCNGVMKFIGGTEVK